jgi:hypothetical protein
MWHLLIITQHWVRKDTRKYQTSSVTLKLIKLEMLWYQCSFQQTYLVKSPQILQPVALLMFRVEVIQMFLPIVPIQICQAKLVLCFTGQSSMFTHRRFEQVLCNLCRVEKTERLIIYFNKLNWFTEMYLPTLSNNTRLSYEDLCTHSHSVCWHGGLPRKT